MIEHVQATIARASTILLGSVNKTTVRAALNGSGDLPIMFRPIPGPFAGRRFGFLATDLAPGSTIEVRYGTDTYSRVMTINVTADGCVVL